jgi:hypothetical protein
MSAIDALRKKVRKETRRVCCPPVHYTITYDANNEFATGQQTDPTLYQPNATVHVLGVGSITNVGFTFVSWNTSPYGSGVSYSEGNTFVINSNVVLYAQWVM